MCTDRKDTGTCLVKMLFQGVWDGTKMIKVSN